MFVFEHFVNISFNALEKFIHCYDLSVNTPVFRQEEAGKEKRHQSQKLMPLGVGSSRLLIVSWYLILSEINVFFGQNNLFDLFCPKFVLLFGHFNVYK